MGNLREVVRISSTTIKPNIPYNTEIDSRDAEPEKEPPPYLCPVIYPNIESFLVSSSISAKNWNYTLLTFVTSKTNYFVDLSLN